MHTLLAITLTVAATFASTNPGVSRAPQSVTTSDVRAVKIYDVSDMLSAFGPSFPAPKLGVPEPLGVEGASSEGRAHEPSAAELRAANAPVLRGLLSAHLQPAVAAEQLELTPNGALIANLLPAQHERTQAILDQLRSFDGMVEVETQYLRGPSELLKSLELDQTAVLTTPEALAELEQRLAECKELERIRAPKLTTLAGRRSSISITDEYTFVRDWRLVRAEPGAQEIADPDIAVLRTGTALDMRALPLPGDLLDLEFELQQSELVRPVPTKRIARGATGREFEIALPAAETQRFESRVLLHSGTGVVLVGSSSDPAEQLVVLVKARRVER
ncbi:MAG: hypothetical protein IT454_17300 [Planctomycetes bacterium]|nr:hypothetical protein [Planctomycetota bacterium]